MKFLMIAVLTALSMSASAQTRGGYSEVERLEDRVRNLEYRLFEVERKLGIGNNRPDRYEEEAVCLLTGKYSKVAYLGKGANNLDAEFEARKSCQTNDSYGANGCTDAVQCDKADRFGRTKTCIITGTYSRVVYKGSAKTALEATYNARKDCQSKDSYGANGCNATPVCSE